MKPAHTPGTKIIIHRSQKAVTVGITIKHAARPKHEITIKISGFKILKTFVAVAAPMKNATDLTVKIHDTVFTVTSQFLANVGKVGPVTLKNFNWDERQCSSDCLE